MFSFRIRSIAAAVEEILGRQPFFPVLELAPPRLLGPLALIHTVYDSYRFTCAHLFLQGNLTVF
jgi:hypothetical protein